MDGRLAPVLFGRPSWVPYGASLAFDFTRGRGWTPNAARPAAGMLTTTRASDAYAGDNAGSWQAFTSGQPRITDKGLLVEESRTNLFLNSGVPATQSITVVNASVYTVSVIGTGSVTLSGAGSGTASQGSPVTFAASTTSLTCTTAGITGTFVNVNVELGSFATSPIRTAGASATRAADTITVNNFSSWFTAGAGTLFGEVNQPSAVTGRVANFNNGTTDNRIEILLTSSGTTYQGLVVDATVTQAGPSSGAVSAGVTSRGALAWTTNDFATSGNGAAVGTDVSGTVPSVTALRLGSSVGISFLSGYVRRVAYWPTRLSNAQLQALTG